MRLIDLTDYPSLRYENGSDDEVLDRALGTGALPAGQYAFARARDGSVYLVRDPVGCNKLFFGRLPGGDAVVANRIERLWHEGLPLAEIGSCPPGHVLRVTQGAVDPAVALDVSSIRAGLRLDPGEFAAGSRAVLDAAFAVLAQALAARQFVVCLSGGLDSSVVASFAARHLKGVVAASFTYLDDADLRRRALGAPVERLESASEDFRCAARVAAALELPLLPVVRPRQAVAAAVDVSVRLCQDWRDFNVHCATVNLFLAQDIRAAFPGRKVVVLTGDLMNEYLCDYRAEEVDGTAYYKIPRVPLDRRRKYFVRGLDAGDREIGVFWGYGLTACQPYTVLAERYMRVPAPMLEQPDIKWTLNGPLLTPAAAPHVSRSKTRAQVGGKDLGTLGIYHRLGVGESELKRVWQEQFPGESAAACEGLIQFGRYRLPPLAAGA